MIAPGDLLFHLTLTDEANKGGVIHRIQQFRWRVTWDTVVGVEEEEQTGENQALGGHSGLGEFLLSRPIVLKAELNSTNRMWEHVHVEVLEDLMQLQLKQEGIEAVWSSF